LSNGTFLKHLVQ